MVHSSFERHLADQVDAIRGAAPAPLEAEPGLADSVLTDLRNADPARPVPGLGSWPSVHDAT